MIINGLLLIAVATLGVKVIIHSQKNQVFKKDAAELNHFEHGLFSVNVWKEKIASIISNEIDKFYLSPQNQKTLQKQLEQQLAILIDKMNERIVKENSKTKTGIFKQTLIDSFVDVKDIKKGVPEYAKAIMKELNSPKTERELKAMLKEKIHGYMKKTYDIAPNYERDRIIQKYRAPSSLDAKKILQQKIAEHQHAISHLSIWMAILSSLIFLFEGLSKGPLRPVHYYIMTLTLVCLLVVGVSTPMIDMEAKIPYLGLILFDHPVEFRDQVIFYQSKSIWDVFMIMVTHKDLQMKLVGILMVCFSIVFPVVKMLSSLAYYYDYSRARNKKLIQFFVLKSGKWSMADVVVVAIFMSYIGFNGIINNQLGKIQEINGSVQLMTTNGTSLQPGFYVFLTYTILAMFLSGFVHNRAAEQRGQPS